jgi:hypothetical protein
MKLGILLAAFLLLVGSAGAVYTLSVTWISGQPIIHRVQTIDAVVDSAPSVGESYYFCPSCTGGVSTDSADAVITSDINASGNLVYTQHENKIGDCTFKAIISNNGQYKVVTSESLTTGESVSKGNVVKWLVIPNSASVEHCKIKFDLNVVS